MIPQDPMVFALEKEGRYKNLKRRCSACSIDKRCLKCRSKEEEDDLEFVVAPRQRLGNGLEEDHVSSSSLEREERFQERRAEVGEHREAEGSSPLAGRTRRKQRMGEVIQAPLRQAVGNNGPVMVKVPFSITDLRSWKETVGIYREDLERVAKVVETIIRTQDPDWNDIQLGEEEVEFLVDTGAIYSVLNTCKGNLSQQTISIIGATRQKENRPFFQSLKFGIGKRVLTHQFLYMPDCPVPLLGRDILSKLNAQITFEKGKIKIRIPENKALDAQVFMLQKETESPEIPEEVENTVTPLVWASGTPGRSRAAEPVVIQLKPDARPVRRKQYPIKLEARKGLEPLIEQFISFGLLRECQSEYNTPMLPVKKLHSEEYRLVQDLRAINQIVQDVHPVVANLYTLLTTLKETDKWFTVLDLKDAFFCLPLAAESQELFAFGWESPKTGRKTQLCWTVLPQGFKNSPTIFGNQLAKELEDWQKMHENITLLQYVDDILLAASNKEDSIQMTIDLLNFLGLAGYKVSRKKAQITRQEVTYLGLTISQGQRSLGTERKEAICQIPEPKSKQELREFLGMAGWCRLWIMNFGLIAEPLYEAIQGGGNLLVWTQECRDAFTKLKQTLMSAPALGLPNLEKLFELFVHERLHVALGVLAQKLGSWKRPMGYFSKQLDNVSKGWPACLRAVAATILLIQEARKLTLGQKLTVFVPHAVTAVLEQKGGHWLSPSRILNYQAILLEQDDVELKVTTILNPATFLTTDPDGGELTHDCLQTMEQTYSSRADLKDMPMENVDWDLFVDGSSFMRDGTWKAGYAVVTIKEVIEAKALSSNMSAQKAELIALLRALELSKDKTVNIWTDSKFAFGIVHAHGAIWKERGLLTSQGSPVKYGPMTQQLLQAINLPKLVAIIHCKAHQLGNSPVHIGNRMADKAAKEAAENKVLLVLPEKVQRLGPRSPQYTPEDNQLANLLKANKNQEGWVKQLFKNTTQRSNPDNRHCGYSDPGNRHCDYSNHLNRHGGYSDPSDRHCGYSNHRNRHGSYSNPGDRHCG
ncbi:uncharacterized protein LOC127027997 [Gymnogyps californianus]|uniref:uncharacterized protein LOC127027997 n=1 Tax=Gymnogyps californianus TaxID=33616 RepID=UPI0021C7F97A|nr:uncharacterized protein LOC127027997 [Gymnogyps californianus]